MERLLQYVWKYKMFPASNLTTTTGQNVSILDTGIQNADAGPDFFNAKIIIEDKEWAGNVEVHTHASDWIKHSHDKDRRYDSVILHVVSDPDMVIRRTNGEVIPQFLLTIPLHIQENYTYLLERERSIACLDQIALLDSFHLMLWESALLSERLERKTGDIFGLLQRYSGDWNEVFYITLCRNFGFGINSDAFELLAKSLPLKYLQKHRNNIMQVEALLFGQAGMLQETNADTYYKALQSEYYFLKHKFSLQPMDETLYRSLRIRPANFPHLKMAQLAAVWSRYDTFFSEMLEVSDRPEQLRALFRIQPSPYWETHYHFNSLSGQKPAMIGENALNILLINTVVPMLFAYGTRNKLPEYTERALQIIESLPPEVNSIVTLFRQAGMPVRHAGDSQALIQLKRVYCENKKCLYCRIGFNVLQKK